MVHAAYQDADRVYRADTCAPLRAAVASGTVSLDALARPPYPGSPLSPGELAGVATVGRWDAPHDQAWGLPWHHNEGIELTYVSHGEMACAVEVGARTRSATLRAGDLSLTRPWQRHRLGDPTLTACRVHWLILDVGVRRPHQRWRWPTWVLLGDAMRQSLRGVVQRSDRPFFRADQALGRAVTDLSALTRTPPGPLRAARLAVAANQVLVHLVALIQRESPPLEDALTVTRAEVGRFLATLSERAVEPWTLDTMAQSCSLGRTQFARHCRAITNMSPWQFVLECRLQRSLRLLVERPDMRVTEVALECGFGSSQRFAAVFRERFGLSPGGFRRSRAVASS